MNTTYFYGLMYATVLFAAILAAYFHMVSPDVVAGLIGAAFGHSTGLFTPIPSTQPISPGTGTPVPTESVK